MNEQEILEAIGRLITEAHRDRYPSRRQFAIATGMDVKTITTAEKGEREMYPNTQRRLEDALHWRKGSIQDLWENRASLDPGALTVAEMERGYVEGQSEGDELPAAPVGNLSQFYTEEIMAELMYRIRNYKAEIERLKQQIAEGEQPET
jgi:hypothetical protein